MLPWENKLANDRPDGKMLAGLTSLTNFDYAYCVWKTSDIRDVP